MIQAYLCTEINLIIVPNSRDSLPGFKDEAFIKAFGIICSYSIGSYYLHHREITINNGHLHTYLFRLRIVSDKLTQTEPLLRVVC